jgi:hypothetical protein
MPGQVAERARVGDAWALATSRTDATATAADNVAAAAGDRLLRSEDLKI